MKSTRYIVTVVLLMLQFSIFSQKNDVYLLGNLKGPKLEKRLRHLSLSIDQETKGNEFTLLLLGDLRQKNTVNETILLDFLKQVELKNGKIIAVTGDRDWDKSREYGLDTVAAMEERFLQSLGHSIFIPKHNCPGPQIIDLNDRIRIIGINSQWWLHQYRKTLPIDSECKNITESEILDELDEAIETVGNKQVILMMHHPIISGGIYGGTANLKEHIFPYKHDKPNNKTFLPIYGTFYHNYRRNIGNEQDMSSNTYETFVKDIEKILRNHSEVIVCSSHEYDMQVLKTRDNYQIISGALLKTNKVKDIDNTLHATNHLGFVKLEIYQDSSLAKIYYYDKPTNAFNVEEKFALNDLRIKKKKTGKLSEDNSKNKIGDQYYGGDYKAGAIKKLFFGSLYRDAWSTPLSIPTLDLDTAFGGLTPLKEGGGLQTVSLKFKDQYGRKYAFRSINKTPAKSIPVEFRVDLVKDITQDMTATQHPYGALFVSSLLDATDLHHEKAQLYIMPDSPKLGEYRKKFGGMFGMLELKPTELDNLEYSYKNANSVKGSLSVFKKLYHSPKHRIDTNLFAKARIFDIFIGDWDRHEDNWKWLGYKSDSSTTYKIYPKDRDHAFSRMDGLFYFLADREWGVAFRENFGYKFSGLVSLTSKGNHMDRMLLSGLKQEDWESLTKDLLSEITDETIETSLSAFPKEIRDASGRTIADKLKSRRKYLVKAIDDYYKYISKEVDVLGTNKEEWFDIHRKDNGETRVQLFSKKLNNELLYDRTFKYNETQEIRLYGLGGIDSFYIHGNSHKAILLRIIGGNGQDVVNDVSKITFGTKKNLVYDYPEGVQFVSDNEVRDIISTNPEVNEYNQQAFKSNTYFPIPIFMSNPDDGIGGGFALSIQKHGFGHHKYKSITTAKAYATSNGANRIKLENKRHIARSDWYITSSFEIGNSFRYYKFYGVGNNTTINDSLNDLDLYRTRYHGGILALGVKYDFLERSSFTFQTHGEFLTENQSTSSYFDVFPNTPYEALNAGGASITLDIDFRDNPNFTNRGLQLSLSNLSLTHNEYIFGKTSFELSYYGTSKIILPITLGVKVGTIRAYGDRIPFYHLANLGQSNNLRGYLQNRFSGKAANYVNNDLRIHFGKTKSDFLPLYYGVILFYDIGQITEPDNFIDSKWHPGYGAGLYITPLNKDFITLQFNIENSEEQEAFLKVKFGVLL